MKKQKTHTYGRKQGGGRGQVIAPERVAVSSFGRRKSLSDLAVWGFPEFSRKIFPLKLLHTLFHPFFFPSTSSSNSPTPQNPPYNSLDQAFSPFLPPLPLFPSSLLFLPLSVLYQSTIGPPLNIFGIPPQGLLKASKRLQKAPKGSKRLKGSKKALFRSF